MNTSISPFDARPGSEGRARHCTRAAYPHNWPRRARSDAPYRFAPLLCLLLVLIAAPRALAYPPAPHHQFYGMVRDEYGSPLASGAEVILRTSAGVQLKTRVIADIEVGMNYRLEIPMDAGLTAAPYKPTALRPAVPFEILVVIGGKTNLPIELKGQFAQMGQPGQRTRLDLTLGEDADGDGLPDAWERLINRDLTKVHPGDNADGDGLNNLQEYLAGTYAMDPENGFSLNITGMNQGRPLMNFLAIRGRTYTLLGSADLNIWVPVKFRIPAEGAGAVLRQNYAASDVRMVQVEADTADGSTEPKFFKLMLQ